MTPHPHAEILRAIADGKEIQFAYDTEPGNWLFIDTKTVLSQLHTKHYHFRVKPETILINCFWCPAPVEERYSKGFALDIQCNWTGKYRERLWFQSEADAKTVFDALILPFKETTK